MNEKQWVVLGIFFIIIGMWFSFLNSSVWGQSCQESVLDFDAHATTIDVFACIKSEIYTPFIWIFYPLGLVCFYLGRLEPKKNEKRKS